MTWALLALAGVVSLGTALATWYYRGRALAAERGLVEADTRRSIALAARDTALVQLRATEEARNADFARTLRARLEAAKTADPGRAAADFAGALRAWPGVPGAD